MPPGQCRPPGGASTQCPRPVPVLPVRDLLARARRPVASCFALATGRPPQTPPPARSWGRRGPPGGAAAAAPLREPPGPTQGLPGMRRGPVVESCVAAAGYSVGEFAALVFAGALGFAEALYAVKVRAEAMQKASEAVPSGMLSVIGRREANYKFACLEARKHCESLGIENPICEISNYLFPDSRVIAGHLQALEFLQENARKYYFTRTKMLPVSGAFHTRLMEPAVEPLAEVLKSIEIQKPLVCVYSNVDGKKYMHSKHIQKLLVKQVVSPVMWEQTMHSVYERKQGTEFPYTYEVGPGKQLGAVLKKCNLKAWKQYNHVDALEDEEAADT
ncbi:PREDICTED: malonyl-CoA-acyl carrier protein transacylase, mitochondrial [Aptenodytes forsteri]|uniref:malonyl-CoA-acyl carrier protein transacylase, mitochondrial n=1 Tax=Aptenodytes forsteri TaxID=9233 RepID=UPI0004F3F803|nr:PREDICTED: malonyl-CoA-acyl carrier protein transacylase, mitochondrial [Aptenodytes forsteri]